MATWRYDISCHPMIISFDEKGGGGGEGGGGLVGSKLPPIPDPPCHHTSVSVSSYISIRAFIHQYPGLHTSVSGPSYISIRVFIHQYPGFHTSVSGHPLHTASMPCLARWYMYI